ncbi:MAG: hypothetical protein WEB06_17985 [Actinomycetota bacterium]
MPESASFSVRRPNYRRRRTFTVLGLLGASVVVVLLLTRGGGPLGGSDEPPIPKLEFAAQVKHVFQGKAAGASSQQGEIDGLTEMFNEYYQQAFVDPGAWGDGTFEDLAGLFVEEARASFQRDLPALTIGEARTELKRVDLGSNSFALSIYWDSKQKPTFAVASVQFEGRGILKRSGPAVTISQAATYYLQKVGSSWKISAYDTTETQTTPTPSPTASPSS